MCSWRLGESFLVAGLDEIKRWVLSFAPEVVVLEPGKLKEMVRKDLSRNLAQYSKPPVSFNLGHLLTAFPRQKRKRFMTEPKSLIPSEIIEKKIFLLRGQKVTLNIHLGELYQVDPRVLIQAVKRNIERFPKDFMFQLTKGGFNNLKSQIVISSWGGLRRAGPYAFTEQGIAMLSSVLNSSRAIQVNIEIMSFCQAAENTWLPC